MCRRWALLLGLLAGPLLGCATGGAQRSASWFERFRPFHGPTGPDVVQLDTALIERPVGDLYINQELWANADEQVIALERKGVIEDNGFRVGQVGGITPAQLQAMLTSERSCVNPRRLLIHADNPTTIKLGAPVPQCNFQVRQDGPAQAVNLEQAECSLIVLPCLDTQGRVRLHFTPQIETGKTSLLPRPAADLSGWILQEQRPTQRYENLSWDVSLSPNEYVMVGARFDARGTLGHQCFIRGQESPPVQRLLVIRTNRAGAGVDTETAPDPQECNSAYGKSPPLALQAAWTSARGCGP